MKITENIKNAENNEYLLQINCALNQDFKALKFNANKSLNEKARSSEARSKFSGAFG